MLPDGSVLALGGNSISGVVSRATVDGAVIRATLLGARAWHSATALPDGTMLIVGGIDAKDGIPGRNL